MKNNIKDLFNLSKNKSRKWEKYFSIYEEIFKDYKNKDITFVEIGVHNGGSLNIWKSYFSKNSRIIGIDINPDCKKFAKEGIEIFIGNQSNPIFWKDFFNKVGKVDIILDDGGHTNLDQITTTVSATDKINDGGLLVIEDTHSSYFDVYNSSNKFSFVEFSKKIIDDINLKNSKNFKQFKFSLSNLIYSVQTFEGIIVFRIDRERCHFNMLLTNDGLDHEITDMTWTGNELNIKFLKKLLSFFSFFMRTNKLLKFLKNQKNNKIISKYFD
jgi:23S rRNA U2552 (ribose-2'-O)-methylase RlmE/FtsJ